MKERLRHLFDRVSGALRTTKGRNVLIYLAFVCVAFIFWCLMSLDSEVQRNYDIPLRLENFPDSLTVIHDIPGDLSATVQGKGSQLLRFIWGEPSPMKVQFDASAASDGTFTLSQQKLEARLRDYFGGGVSILSVKPDSLSLTFTASEGKRVALHVNAQIETDLQSIESGIPVANVDSVTLYSTGPIPRSITSVSTELLSRTGLTDTTRFDVKVQAPRGMRVIPDHVIVTVPVEQLVSKKVRVEVNGSGVPDGTRLLLFPSSVEVSFLVPISNSRDEYPIRAYVDYREAARSTNGKAAVLLGPIPGRYYSISHSPDSVEFIIEHD